MIRVTSVACTIMLFPTAGNAEECSNYEAQVFRLVEQVGYFQTGMAFQKYGWSSAGPTNGWLDQFKEVRDSEENSEGLQFLRDYGFSLAHVYQVADEYRTTGYLDSFYQDMESSIQKAKPCSP